MRVECAVVSHEGNVRTNNEDNYFLNGSFRKNILENRRNESMENKRNKYVFSVCDGMGGEEYGEVASLCAVKSMEILKEKNWSKQVLEEFIKNAKNSMKEQTLERFCDSPGATVTILILENNRAYTANLGDSRIYLFKGGILKQMSKDHTQAQLMVDHGMLGAEEARKHRGGHILTRYLGTDTEVFPEDFSVNEPVELDKGDLFLLCSDGLTDMLADSDIETCIRQYRDKKAEELASTLCSRALSAGGKDNVTCLIVKIKELSRKGVLEILSEVFGKIRT